jgi:hypothetical protein
MVSTFPKFNEATLSGADPAFPYVEIVNLGGVIIGMGLAFYNGSVTLTTTPKVILSISGSLPKCTAIIMHSEGFNYSGSNSEVYAWVNINGSTKAETKTVVRIYGNYIGGWMSSQYAYDLDAGNYTFDLVAQAQISGPWIYYPKLVVLVVSRK